MRHFLWVRRLETVKVTPEDAGISFCVVKQDQCVTERNEPRGYRNDVVVPFVTGLGIVVENECLIAKCEYQTKRVLS